MVRTQVFTKVLAAGLVHAAFCHTFKGLIAEVGTKCIFCSYIVCVCKAEAGLISDCFTA